MIASQIGLIDQFFPKTAQLRESGFAFQAMPDRSEQNGN